MAGGRVEPMASGVDDVRMVTQPAPRGPRGLWAALVVEESSGPDTTPVGREIDLRASGAHLEYLASLAD